MSLPVIVTIASMALMALVGVGMSIAITFLLKRINRADQLLQNWYYATLDTSDLTGKPRQMILRATFNAEPHRYRLLAECFNDTRNHFFG